MNTTTERYSANESIDKFILGEKFTEFKHKFITDDACPYCDLENKLICSPVFPAILDKHADTIVRGKNEHEAGHARLTPAGKNPAWSALKGNLINVLEDLRIERGICKLSPAFQSDLDYLNNFFIGKIQSKMAMENDTTKPLNEALIALHIRENGHTPAWNLSDKAQQYFDAVKDIFGNWKNADCDTPAGFPAIEKLADEILAIWNEVKDKQQDSNGNGQGNGQDGKQDGNGNSGAENSKDGQDKQDGQENAQNGNGNGEKQDNAGQQGEDSNGQNGEGEDGQDSNAGQQDGEGENGQQGNSTEDGQDGNGQQSQQDGNGEKQDNKQGKSGKSDKQDGQERESSENGKSSTSTKGNGGHGESDAKSDLSEDFANEDVMGNEVRKEMEKIIEDGKSLLGDYRAYTAEDTFIHSKENLAMFEKALSLVRGRIARLSGALEQSLKSMSRNRNLNNRENGNLNMKALHVIAKNLSQNVFYKTVKGISLDTTVTLLIDESGSTSCYTQRFMALAIAISEVLDRLGIKFEVLGHSTGSASRIFSKEETLMFHRKKPIVFFEHKRFEDNYRKEKYRLGSMSSYYNNVDGEVLIEAFKRANAQRSSRHIILVLSDGEPSGTGSFEVGCKNLVKAVDFCRKNGTEVYAFGIETTKPRNYYGKDNFIYLDDASKLSETFIRQFSEVITKGKLVK